MNADESDWVVAVCSVVFDLDVGQQLEHVYPNEALSEPTASAVAFHAFPDSMSLELQSKTSVRDSTFFFRLRVSKAHAQEDAHLQPTYLYGFVFCRQRQDEKLRRGGEQKSVVILSHQPYSSTLIPLAQYAGPLYFNNGSSALQEVYQEVLDWEPPVPGVRCILEIGGSTLITQVPDASALPPPAPPELCDPYIPLPFLPSLAHKPGSLHGAFHEPLYWSDEGKAEPQVNSNHPLTCPIKVIKVDLFTPFSALLHHLWHLWELLLLAEPLIVLAPSPGECSTAVAGLLTLITPLPYGADFRPYFTIHDPDFQQMTSAGVMPDSSNLPRLLGVTNRYFLKALQDWPNTMAVGEKPVRTHNKPNSSPGAGAESRPQQGPSRLGRALAAVRQRAAGPPGQLGEHVQGLWTRSKPLTKPDQRLLDRLVKPLPTDSSLKVARLASHNSEAIRSHFVELTTAVLMPFAPYCQAAEPPEEEPGVAEQQCPYLPAFSHAAFMEQLQSSPLPLLLQQHFRSQAACVQFYRSFIQCPNFMTWFERRRAAATAWQEEAWSIAAADVQDSQHLSQHAASETQHAASLSDVQLVEAFFDLEGRLDAALTAANHPAPTPEVAAQAVLLRQELLAVFEEMPRDLQQTMLSSPQRAALLQVPGPQNKVPGQPRRQA